MPRAAETFAFTLRLEECLHRTRRAKLLPPRNAFGCLETRPPLFSAVPQEALRRAAGPLQKQRGFWSAVVGRRCARAKLPGVGSKLLFSKNKKNEKPSKASSASCGKSSAPALGPTTSSRFPFAQRPPFFLRLVFVVGGGTACCLPASAAALTVSCASLAFISAVWNGAVSAARCGATCAAPAKRCRAEALSWSALWTASVR